MYWITKFKNLITNIKIFVKYQFIKKNQFKFMSQEQMIDLITEEKYSMCRFGDGELRWAFNIKNETFQKNDPKMAKMLKEILFSKENSNVIICLYECMNNVNEYVRDGRLFWRKFMVIHKDNIIKQIPKERVYGAANITRPYIEYKNKDKSVIEKKFNLVKKIWNNREVIIVEGKYTRLGVNNDLFDNCKSIERIICPPSDAFFLYDEICNEIRKIDKNKLIVLALGPTATIIAYYLTLEGYQCVDIGHVDIEYIWYKKNCKKKEKIPGKYVFEAGGMSEEQMEIDDEYKSQILKEIK